jgi:hypothetical protein
MTALSKLKNFEAFELKLTDIDTDDSLVALLVISSLLQVIKTDSQITSKSDKANISMMIAVMEKQFRASPEEDKQPVRLALLENLETFIKEIRDSVDTSLDS